MTKLAGCIKKAGKSLNATDAETVQAAQLKYSTAGMSDSMAGIKAVQDVINQLVAEKSSALGMVSSESAKLPPKSKPKGVGLKAAQIYANQFLKKYSGAGGVTIDIHATQESAFGAKSRGTYGKVKAGYDEQADTVYLVAENLDSLTDLQATLQHEILAHKGLGFFAKEDVATLLSAIEEAAPKSKTLAPIWAKVQKDYAGESTTVMAEELFARVAEGEMSLLDKQWTKIVTAVRALLRKAGWVGNEISYTDMRAMAYNMGDAFAQGKKVRQNSTQQTGASNERDSTADGGKADSQEESYADLIEAANPDNETLESSGAINDLEQGREITVLHRSDAKFDTFDDSFLGANSKHSTSLLGHFASLSDVGFDDTYGKNLTKHKVRLKNVLTVSEGDFADMVALSDDEVKATRKALMDAGIDGMAVLGLDWVVVFEGKNLTKDDIGMNFSRAQSALGLHSGVERAIEGMEGVFNKNKSTPGDRVFARLNKAGVKKDEIELLGLPEFLQGRDVTQDETLAFIRSNGLRLEEVVATEVDEQRAGLEFTAMTDVKTPTYASQNIGGTIIYIAMESSQNWAIRRGDPKKGQLIGDDIASFSEAEIQANEWASDDNLIDDVEEGETKYGDYIEGGFAANYRENKLILPDNEGTYAGGHFDDDNVLAFTRVTDRTIDGSKTYFVEEMQSDWHSDARKAGRYHDKELSTKLDADLTEATVKSVEHTDSLYRQISEKNQKKYFNSDPDALYQAIANRAAGPRTRLLRKALSDEDIEAAGQLVDEEKRLSFEFDNYVMEPGPPDAPFKGDKWLALTMKRSLIDAAERGAESIAWPTANMMNSRWSDSFDYGPQYDKKMTSLLKKLTGIAPEKKSVEWSDDHQIWSAPLSAELRDTINTDGFMMFSREGGYTPEQEEAISVGGFGQRTKKPLKEKYEEKTYRWRNKMRQGVVDQFDSFKSIVGDNKAWMMSHLSNSSNGALEAVMRAGHIALDKSGAITVDSSKKSLEETLKPLGAELDDWLMWIAGNRAEKLSFEGRENLFSDDHIQALKSLSAGKLADGSSRAELYESARKDFEALGNSVMQVGVDTGLINREEAKAWEEEGFYLPFYRMMEEGGRGPGSFGNGLVRQSAYKKLKGADMQLDDLLSNVLTNWSHILGAGLKNQAAKTALESASKIDLAVQTNEHAKGKDAVFVRIDGQKVWYDIADGQDGALVLSSLVSLSQEGLNNPAMKALRAFKRVLTIGVTASPQFKIANLFRDTIQAAAVADMSTNIAKNLYEGFKATKKGSNSINQMIAGGGAFGDSGYIHGSDPEAVRYLIDKGFKRDTIITSKHYAGLLWDKYQDFGARMENVNRAANFEQALLDGKDMLTANFESRDHLDFSRTGSFTSVRVLAAIIPFLNARLQGLDKLGRAAMDDGQRKQFLTVVGMYSAASIALYLAMKDDEDYQEAEDWERDTYHLFKIPGSGVMYRLPRPFEVGAIASTIERLLEQMVDDEVHGALFAERLGHTIAHTFSFNPMPQALKPVAELWANKNSFTGRSIESASMKNLSPTERKRVWTSETAIGISAGMDAISWGKVVLSPVQIEHLVRGYLGWAGSTALAGTDIAVRGIIDAPDKPAKKVTDYPVISRFVREGKGRSSKYVTTFYDRLGESNQLYYDIRQAREYGDLQKATKLEQDGRSTLKHRKALVKVQRKLSQLRKQIARVHSSRTMSAKDKRASIDRLQAKQHKYAKLIVKRTEPVK